MNVALAGAGGLAIVATAAVAVPSIRSGGSPNAQPSASPLPEPQIESITSIDELSVVFPDVTVWEVPRLDFGDGRAFEPDAVDESGRIVGTIVGSDPPAAEQIAVFDPASGEVQTVAAPAHRNVRWIYANDAVIAWAETDDPPQTAGAELTWRCVDRMTSTVHELERPGGRGADISSALSDVAIGAGGRIAMTTRSGSFGDIYVAQGCGSTFDLVAVDAAAPRLAGGSLFYLGEDAIWRQEPNAAASPVTDRPAGAEPFNPRFAASEAAVMWFLTSEPGRDDIGSYAISRLDGSGRVTMERPPGFVAPYQGNAWALAGFVAQSGPPELSVGSWIYAPELGVIATFEPTTDPGGVPYVLAAAGDHLLMAQGDVPGDTRWWLVTLG